MFILGVRISSVKRTSSIGVNSVGYLSFVVSECNCYRSMLDIEQYFRLKLIGQSNDYLINLLNSKHHFRMAAFVIINRQDKKQVSVW